MFWDNYDTLCRSSGKSPNFVAQSLGFSTGTVTWWKKGKIPQNATLKKIADYFGVSVDYLLGNEKQKEEVPSEEGTSVVVVSRSGKRFVHHLSPEQLDILNGMIDQFEKNNQ